ncbi:UDP-glucose 4-epimerase GalE [Candidatus Saccharibacteria bacterium]|nr:UDP-glucose 4-epimerase GalE [Candidatus Saccharibacteria bacterium]
MNILVTGGTGYIGSHVVVELLAEGHTVDILDNLANSQLEVLDKIEQIAGTKPDFHEIDLLDADQLDQLFSTKSFDLVIHFAGLKAVAESIEQPLRYYDNNITGTLNLLKSMQNHHAKNLIFSSSATVYGDQGIEQCVETMPTGIKLTNPYGKTKYMIEEILKDLAIADPEFHIIALRYFNPVGNHESGLLGENPNGIPNNLMPYIMKVASHELPELNIFGNDYPTDDGTCLRDYIHVVDLAKGHLAAVQGLKPGFTAYNLGTGHPTSVLEMVHAFERVSGKPLPYKFAPRRPGDLPKLYANPEKAEHELNWHTTLTIDDAIRDILTFISHGN